MNILSTYRVQFHQGFTFNDATRIVPYLHDLGVTHLYASPYLKAVTGSTHGYDVIDHSQLNPEVGTQEDYRRFVKALSDHGMSHILDTVPNHMGVETNDNHWWNDVLANGQQSQFATYFDIDWTGITSRPEMVGKVLLPVLGETLGEALAKNSLQLKTEDGNRFVHYYDRKFPVTGEGDNLAELLSQQAYRLSYWRVANDEINYRRFFDITGLAGMQMQRQEVFNAAHAYTFSLIADGSVAGLRVDHPDGLLDPKQYFDRLQSKFIKDCPRQAATGEPLYVSVEKILNGDETLRQDWTVAGTSGYDFLCQVNSLFVDPANESAMTDIYQKFVGPHKPYADLVYEKKCLLLDTSFNNDLTSLAKRLDAVAQMDVKSQDFSRPALRAALRQVIACFTVYRSYVSERGVSDSDVQVVTLATDRAIERNPNIERSVFDFIRDTILLRYPVAAAARPAQLEFALRFQQLTSPVNAKGIEDTAFYIYNRLISLNEVGGDPDRFGLDANHLHHYLKDRQEHWPLAMSVLSTHDTKRSEDVRARINVLSELPDEWRHCLATWERTSAQAAKEVHPNDRYLIYQTLLGAWPLGPLDDQTRDQLKKRILAYMQKAMREAKVRTSWVAVNEKYESAVAEFISHLIDPQKSAEFLKHFLVFQDKVSRLGMINSLAQTVLRLTASGVCDTYQGTELWDLSLVDPDNRRPVDYTSRASLLEHIQQASRQNLPAFLKEIVGRMEDGRIKLWITHQILQLRQNQPDLFLKGSYQPIGAQGKSADRVFAFLRATDKGSALIIVPRLVASIQTPNGWGDTALKLPPIIAGKRLKNALTKSDLVLNAEGGLPISQALADFPVAVLTIGD